MSPWIVWTFLTLLSWGIWAILFRLIGEELSPAHSQAISTLGIVPVMIALWLAKDAPGVGNRKRGIVLALGSGIISCLGNVACYEALNHAKAATVIPLTALYPVVTVLLAVPFLHERVNVWQWIGICFSLAAIYLFNVPQESSADTGFASSWVLLPIVAIVFWGITGLMQKAATNDISARSCSIWFLAAFLPVAAVILLADPLLSNIAPRTWFLATAMGFSLALGNLTVLLAFASGGKASIIAPLAGLYPLVSIPIAIVAFGERLGPREVWGIALALAAVVMLSMQSESNPTPTTIVDTEASL